MWKPRNAELRPFRILRHVSFRSNLPALNSGSGNRGSRFQHVQDSLPLETPMLQTPTRQDLRHVSSLMNGPKRSSGNRGSRFLDARFLRPRKLRYPDGLNPDAPWLLATCPAEINGSDFPRNFEDFQGLDSLTCQTPMAQYPDDSSSARWGLNPAQLSGI
jgi:hypothetical protein